MKILLITNEPPLNPNEVVSGNAVRSRQLMAALTTAGHSVSQTWLSSRRIRPASSFRNRDELQGRLVAEAPDALIVSYWELLGLLPVELKPFVILDYVAPRSLEELFESPQTVRNSLKRFRLNLERCDAVLVGNEQQGPLLLNNLIEAGFDLRGAVPILTVPLGAEVATTSRSDPTDVGWRMVAGGVTWPWRTDGSFAQALEAVASDFRDELRIVQFGGTYKWHGTNTDDLRPGLPQTETAIEYQDLQPYQVFSRYLSEQAHIGIELAESNLERRFSQSFRSLEFLRHGLPLLCNDYLPIARLVEHYDAGWLVDDPASLNRLVRQIVSQPENWRRKSENAQKLVSEELQPQKTIDPLLKWLESPCKARRLPPQTAGTDQKPVLGVPPLGQRLKRQIALVRQVLMARLFGQKRGTGVVFVTRGDLFPVDHGAAVRTVETARALARSGRNVGIVTDERKHWYRVEDGKEVRVPYPFWVRLLSLPGPLIKLLHFSKNLPYSNSFLYLPMTDGSFQWRIIAAARQVKAGILQAEFPAYALPCTRVSEALECPVVLVEHNVEYERIRAQVPELDDAQYKNLKDIEISLCNRSNAVVCVSDNDRQKLGEDGVASGLMHTILHGVDLQQYAQPAVADGRSRFAITADDLVLIYHGTFSYPPNREALQIFADTLLPALERKGLNCHVLAVGRNPPASSPHPRIHFTGSVTEVAPWLKVADMAVIPLVEGGGTRMKIIDCFAAGLPVISTSKGIEGIPVVSGRHALVIDDWETMAQAICDLRQEPERAQALAQAGREIAASLDWNEIARQYLAVYSAL
jgi:glycosyltransferase involved in cell wall biosynthesis